MNYQKPEVVTTASACAAVQHNVKDSSPFVDALDEETIGAYEADE
jgi:hypothetical protein